MDVTPKIQAAKGKNRQMGLYQTIRFCTVNEKINRGNRKPKNRRKHLKTVNITKHNFLKNIRNSYNSLAKKKKKIKLKRWVKDLDILQRSHTNDQQMNEKVLYVTDYQRNANQTTMRYHFTLVKKDIKKITGVSKDMEKLEPLYPIGRNVKWCSHYGKQHGGFLVCYAF